MRSANGSSRGGGTRCHSVKFPRAVNALPPLFPTAQMALGDTATTKLNSLSEPRLGVGTTVQSVPSQCIASVFPLTDTTPEKPTAQTSSEATIATPLSRFAVGETFGLGTTLQAAPSQCIVNVEAPARPTAHTSSAAIPCTAYRTPPGTAGVEAIVMASPSQCSTNGSLLLSDPDCPTAHTSWREIALIPQREFGNPSQTFGLGTANHFVPFQYSTRVCSVSPRTAWP